MFEFAIRNIRNLFTGNLRSLLTICGIAVGIASVILTIGIGEFGDTALRGEIDSLGMGGLSITSGNSSAPLTERELEEIRGIPDIELVMPVVFEAGNAFIDNQSKQVYLWGIDQNADKTISLSLQSGRFFTKRDIALADKICMVDEKYARDHYGTVDIIGKNITITSGNNTSKYTITGVLKTGSGLLENVMGTVIPDFIYIPLTTMQNNLSRKNYNQIVIKTDEETDIDATGTEILKTIERKTGVKNGYIINNLAKQKESLSNIINIFTIIITSVGAVSLFVAGLNIMNVMLTSVTEKTREIGIKKAIGATRFDIMTEFLVQSSAISLAGCIVGMVAAFFILALIGLITGLTVSINLAIIILIPIFSVVVGSLFGIYPALKAASLRPVDALRYY